MAKNKQNKEDKKKVSGGGIAAALIVALLALGGGVGYGTGVISKDGINFNKKAKTEATTTDTKVTKAIEVVIAEKTITIDNKEVALEDLAKTITDKGNSYKYIIKDNGAIKETYDSVVEVFEELKVEYSEGK